MSEQAADVRDAPPDSARPQVHQPHRSYVSHAKLIGVITLISRFVGLAREVIAFRSFGDTGVWAAWKVAFTVPNLFRKLLGEGALSAAFVPLYAQAVERDDRPNDFAAAAVNLLAGLLISLTVVVELGLVALLVFFKWSPNNLLVLRFSVIMMPYVTLVCLTAFLGGILQVHHRFAAFAFTAVVLNVFLIVIIAVIAHSFDLRDISQQIRTCYWLAAGVLVAGAAQMVMLFPSLRRAGFRFRIMFHCWTPAVRKLMRLTFPLAMGAGVLQIGVMLDKGLGQFLARQPGHNTFTLFGHVIRFPLAEAAAARLDLAQFMYQVPLGVFAIALATAIFPTLGREAVNPTGDGFKRALRQGIEGSLFIGLPATVGMVLVATPAIRFFFEGGQFSARSAQLVARSTAIYSAAIWAFSMLHIINRGFYAIHDATTPLRWTAYNLLINLVVEMPLLWTWLAESGMAMGTLISFSIQALVMLWLIDRRLGSIHMRRSAKPIAKMIAASLFMLAACLVVKLGLFRHPSDRKIMWASELVLLMVVGSVVYFGACMAMGVDVMKHLRRTKHAEEEIAPITAEP